MKRTLLLSALLTTFITGCASTSDQAVETTENLDPRMADCTLATVEDRGPVRPSLFVVGTFPDGQWIHMPARQMGHKGDGLYQVVSDEKAGNVSLQFATMSWTPQYTAAGKQMVVGQAKELKRGGFAKDTVVALPEDGQYLWSIKLTEEKKPVVAMVSKCN